ncbi:glycosyl transferase family 1 [Siminovitchia terrae]|uniref:Glycosyl transferase family 1 n=1 Tax=Siminovitchia terrae TaxID=1914933 RepID=A0ABQ4KZ44_SIMTE|nr:glycosyltransferase [Siminovitchia terrae]GIN96840.1 glycosyl transferase family 1 [Siminovitchia terrae]
MDSLLTYNSNKIYTLTSSLPFVYGGRTSALLQRARILTESDKGIEKVKILTTNYNPNYADIYDDYKRKKTINDHIDFDNIYDFYKWSDHKDVRNNYTVYIKENFDNNLFELVKEKNPHITYFYKDGLPMYYLSRNKETGKIGHIDVFKDNNKNSVKRVYLDSKGNIHKIRYFQEGTDKVISDVFVDAELNAYLTKEFSYKGKEKYIERIILFNKDGTSVVFQKEADFFNYWFEDLFADGDIVINDVRVLDKPLLDVKKNVKRIFQLHNSHLSEPLNVESKTKKSFLYLFENIKKQDDRIIILTNGQKENILYKHPNLSSYLHVIPHCIENNIAITETVKKGQACIVSRLDDRKRLDHAIRAFSSVLEYFPNFQLKIYGDGDDKERLLNTVNELGIGNNVFFEGHTDRPNEIFQSSEFFLITSLYEGFGLTVLESISNGCPVIGYDISWGPSEIVGEKGGIIIENGNVDELGKAMIKMIKNPYNRQEVKSEAERFNKEMFLKQWLGIIKQHNTDSEKKQSLSKRFLNKLYNH